MTDIRKFEQKLEAAERVIEALRIYSGARQGMCATIGNITSSAGQRAWVYQARCWDRVHEALAYLDHLENVV